MSTRSHSNRTSKTEENSLLDNFDHYEWLNESEVKLIDFLQTSDAFKQIHEIEECLWPDVNNYDYRRRMRNDIITSVNKKMKRHLDIDQQLIISKTDPNDRRKKLYGINPDIN